MKRTLFYTAILIAFTANAQVQSYQIISPNSIESKNYYFTSLLRHLPEADSLICSSNKLTEMAHNKQQRIDAAQTSEERINAMKFSDKEIEEAGKVLAALYKPDNALGYIISEHILPSGCYLKYKETGAQLIKQIWKQDAEGMNFAIDVYAAARKPNYPQIDSIGFNIHSRYFIEEILPNVQLNVADRSRLVPRFYSIPMNAVCTLLDINDRRQAIDFEPLSETENKKAYEQVKLTNWNSFPYSAILVLGAGPEDPRECISPQGRLSASYAAMIYRQHKAPFIILSGGRVHPYHTPYNEAAEMKKYLMEVWQIPETALIMEPHARHTTTHFRNAARIMFHAGFPMNKYAIATSSRSHIDYVEAVTFPQRCLRELEHIPHKPGKRISEKVIEFLPLTDALIIDPTEPMDP